MKEIHPDLSPDDFDNAISSGMLSVDIGDSGKDDSFGFGRIDGFKAAQTATSLALGAELVFAPQLSLNTTLINMGFSQTAGAFEILNLGGGDITVTSVSSDTSALSVQPANSAEGAGTYTITLDRQGLDSGVYSSYISVLSNAGPASLNIRYEVLPSGEEVNEDLGVMYTLLYNIASGNVEHSVASVAEESGYPFFLEDVDPGVYAVISGTDIDNDGFICGNGESCAIWPSAADPEYLLVNRSLGELELGSYFVNQATLSNLSGNAGAPHKDIYHGSCDGFLISGVCASGVFNRGIAGDSQQPTTGD
jgi:serine protease